MEAVPTTSGSAVSYPTISSVSQTPIRKVRQTGWTSAPCSLTCFAQDAWKLRPNLTLNYGLRWEWNTPQADAGHRIQAFRPGQATAIYPCVLSSSDPLLGLVGSSDCSPQGPGRSVFPLGMVFPGDSGGPAGLTNNYLRAFAPRLGLAWSPSQIGRASCRE